MTDTAIEAVDEWTIWRGTAEYRTLTVVSNVELDSQAVAVSWDRSEDGWIDAEWLGDSGLSRRLRVFIDDDAMPSRSSADVFVRITDNPEIPLIKAGQARFR